MSARDTLRRVTVVEHAWLCTEAVPASLSCAQVTPSAFDHLCQLSEAFGRNGARLAQVAGRTRLKLDSHVGVIETPCGTVVEILPKQHGAGDEEAASRALLRKLLLADLDVPVREVGAASLQAFDGHLVEWVMRRFLEALDNVVRRGLRFDYQGRNEELPVLRGRWDVAAQMRQPPGREHRFQVHHAVFLADRPENRLLRRALDEVLRSTVNPHSWRLAQELTVRLAEVAPSCRVEDDFRAWRHDRLLAHYREVRPWCELILRRQVPLALAGARSGLSLLFPMEKLFERYVARWLRRRLPASVDLRTPARSHALCTHQGRPMFRLEPDLLVDDGTRRWVLDTKWKLLDSARPHEKYRLASSDFYQLHAYGHTYLGGRGQLALIYPRTPEFPDPLPPFEFSEELSLRVLPFDLATDTLWGLEQLQLPT